MKPNRYSPFTSRSLSQLVFAIAVAQSVRGAVVNWNNPGGGTWNTASNWSSGAVPGANDDVVINLSSTNLVVTYSSGATSVRSIQCTGAFSLSGGAITVTSGSSQFSGPLVVQPGGVLAVDGAQASLTVTGPATVDGAGLMAGDGGVLSMPGLRSYTEPAGCQSLTWVANGVGSTLSFPGLTNLTGGSCGIFGMQALGGGQVVVNNLVELADGNVSVYAGGTNSVVDLSGLVASQGTNFLLSVEADSGGDVLLPHLSQASRMIFTVSGGSVVSVPSMGSYQTPAGCGSLTWVASGAGSLLNLPGLTNLTGGSCGTLAVQALLGGQVMLSNLVDLVDGNVSVYTEGTNSIVDLSVLPNYPGTNFTFTVEAKAGGSVLMPKLTDAGRVSFALDGGGFISTAQIRSLFAANLSANGGAIFSFPRLGTFQEPPGCGALSWVASGTGSILDLSALTNLVGGNCGTLGVQALLGGQVMLNNLVDLVDGNVSVYTEGTNSIVDLSVLPNYPGTNFTFTVEAKGGGSVLMPKLTDAGRVNFTLDGGGFISTAQIRSLFAANLSANGGAVFSFPSLGSYQEPPGCGSESWVASGAGSILDLSALTNLVGGSCGTLGIQALAGGEVLLKTVLTVGDGNLSAYTEGTNSVVDLSGLIAYWGTNYVLSVEAKGGGNVLLPQLTEANRINLTLDGGGSISTEQITTLGSSGLAVSGGSVLSFPSVSSYTEPAGCGSLTWVATGAGSVLNLAGLTNLTGGSCGTLAIQALQGGQVALSNLVALADGNVSVYADGTNSIVDLSALPNYPGTNFTFSVEANDGGSVLMPKLTDAGRVSFTLDPGGFITTSQIRSLMAANLSVNGGAIFSFPGLGTYQEPPGCSSESWVASGAGSVLDLSGLTNLVGGNCGTLGIQATGGGQVQLGNLVGITDGNVSTLADGTTSAVDFSGLVRYQGTNYALSVEARNGGSIPLSKLSIIGAGTLLLNGQSGEALGNIQIASGARLDCVSNLVLNGFETVSSVASGLIKIEGNLLGNTHNADRYSPLGTCEFTYGTHQLEAMSHDLGNVPVAFANNFAYGLMLLDPGAQVSLVDQAVNSVGPQPECVYVNSLIVPSGATLNLNGLHLYARLAQIAGNVTGGTISQVPDNGGPLIPGPGIAASISTAGALDAWTFFGRAGQAIAVEVNPNSAAVPPPPLNFAYVQLLDPSTNLLAQASNTVAQQIVAITGVTLPTDGTYTVVVRAPGNQSANTGNYEVAVWVLANTVAQLPLNQPVHGLIQSPYSEDQWLFSAAFGQQVRFDLANVSAPGLVFGLSGPNGWSGFSNLVGSSDLITLPSSGKYVLTATATGGAYDIAYAFELAQTAQTNLNLGASATGQFSGNGQAQLFAITVTNASPLLITLNNAGANNETELYAKLGSPPTRGVFDFQSIQSGSANQQILIPQAVPGTYYILVYGNYIPSPGAYTIQTQPAGLFLTDATPAQGAHNARLTMTLTGAGFVSSTAVQLISTNGTSVPASEVSVDSFTQMTASFLSNTVPAGIYSVVVLEGSNQATLTNALTIAAAGASSLETRLILPAALGRHAVATLYVEYANIGTAAMPAPLLMLQGIGPTPTIRPVLTLDSSRIVQDFWSSVLPPGTGNRVYILGSGTQPGVLNPGERIRVPVFYLGLQQPWDFSQSSVSMGIRYWTADNTNSIDWSAREASFRPPALDSNTWHVIYGNVTGNLYSSGAYVQMLDNAAQFLSRLGERITDVDNLWNFAVQQASGFQAIPILDSAVDAAMPTPGISLELDRHYSSNLAARNGFGPFGRGWYTPWQMTLAIQGDGAQVQLVGEGGSLRVYTLDSRGGGYFSSAGDSATLTAVGGGIYDLSDASGNTTRFRTDGKIDHVSDPNGNSVTAGYDGGGRLTSLSHSSGSSLSLTYNNAGLVAKVVDSVGRSLTYGYDSGNNYLLTVTTDDGKATGYAYQAGGSPAQSQALSSVTRGGVTRSFIYDGFGRVASTYLGTGDQMVSFTYDPAGPVTVNDGQGTTSLYFDYRGLLAKIMDPLGNSTTAHFDDSLHLSQLISPTGETREFSWCDCGSLAALTDELGHSTTLQHNNPLNRLTSFTAADGNTTSYTYDGDGNLLATTFPDNSSEQFVNYTSSGLPQSYNNRRRQSLSQTYSPSGKIITRGFPDGSSFGFNYDVRGNLLAATNHSASGVEQITSYAYNYATDGDRVRGVTYPNGRWVAIAYDSYGRQQQLSDVTGRTNVFNYDSSGRLSGVTDGAGNPLVGYLYNLAGRLSRINKGNGAYASYDYDAAGNVISLVNHASNGATNSFFDYTYDGRGRRTGVSTVDGNWSYTYDAVGQLVHAIFSSANAAIPNQDLRYVYDVVGNRISTVANGTNVNYGVNGLNQYVTVGNTAFQYDADGNVMFDGANTCEYDPQNLLISVNGAAGTVQYEYDALGNRTASVINGHRVESLIDPFGNVLVEFDGTGQLLAQNVYGEGLAARATDGNLNWYDFDALGSVAGIAGQGAGYLARYSYLPFGELLASSGTLANPFTFDGLDGVTSDATGLFHTSARSYEPGIGRFGSIDPLRLNGGKPHDYTYAANDPVLMTDPSGQCFIIGGVKGGPNNFVGFSIGTSTGFSVGASAGAGLGVTSSFGPGGILGPAVNFGLASGGAGAYAGAGVGVSAGVHEGASLGYSQGSTTGLVIGWGWGGGCPPPSDIVIIFPCDGCDDGGGDGDGGGQGGSGTAGSQDPNELIGPAGYSVQNFVIAIGNLFSYEIVFENETNATAPAQAVRISDTLSTNLDWSTFQLTQIGFGDQFILPPANSQYFQTNVAFVYAGVPFQVQIEAGIRPVTGEVFANFFSIDPRTSLPPAVNVGFLPPEDGTGRGVGHVSYSVQPKPNLPTGLVITNVALIQFDVNPVIATDQADPNDPSKGVDTNKMAAVTIDNTPPVSAVRPLPAIEPTTNFVVKWSGSDVGSGVASYDIYSADNASGWAIWLAGTTNASATFDGQNGHTYGFYSIAHDGAGNVELAPSSADTVTTVNTSAGPLLSISESNLPNGQGFQIVLTFPVQAGYNYEVQYREDLGQGSSWQPLPGAPHNSGMVTDILSGNGRFYRLQRSPQ